MRPLAFAALLSCAAANAAESITYVTSSGRWLTVQQETTIAAAQKSTGVSVRVDATAERYGPLKTQVMANRVTWDLMEMPSHFCRRAATEGLWEKLDYAKIPNAQTLPAEMRTESYVGFITYSNVLAYNADRYAAKQPRNWADFWNVKDFPGARSMRNTPRPTLEIALMADGVAPDQLYPLDVERAYRKLAQIKPHVSVWWMSGGQAIQLLADGEVDMMAAWNGSAAGAVVEAKAPIRYAFDQGVMEYTCLAVPKGAKKPEQAMSVINAYLAPQNLAAMSMKTDYGSLNPAANPHIPAERQAHLPSSPANLALQATMSAEWWASPAGVAAEERWLRFMQEK